MPFALSLCTHRNTACLALSGTSSSITIVACPSGCSASCKMFETLSNALQWIASSKLHMRNISHVLADFQLLARDKAVGQAQLSSFLSMCADIGIPVAPDKTVQPTQVTTFLGLELHSMAIDHFHERGVSVVRVSPLASGSFNRGECTVISLDDH